MKRVNYFIVALAISSLLTIMGCANGGNESKGTDTTATPAGPAPDNSAATNPSLADTLHDNKDTMASDSIRR
jgi:hypothetical protein